MTVTDAPTPAPPTATRPGITLSVAAPAFNEAENIAGAVEEWSRYLSAQEAITDWEIVICNDGSTDRTGEILTELEHTYRNLVVVDLEENKGAAVAIATAIEHTSLDWVLLTDSDRQFPIANLDRFLGPLSTGNGAAFSGARATKADGALYRWGSAASGAVSNLLLSTRYRDFNSIFKLVRGSVLRSIHLESAGMNCSTEITARVAELGLGWIEIEIEHRARDSGRRGWRFWRGARDRALFVGYLGIRRLLLHQGVLRRESVPSPVSTDDVALVGTP